MNFKKSIGNSSIKAFIDKQKDYKAIKREEESVKKVEEAAKQREEAIDLKIVELTNELENLKTIKENGEELKINFQGSARQIALAFYYMHNSNLIPNKTGTNTIDAEFIRFLTGKDKDTIRRNLKDPKKIKRKESSGKATKALLNDLIIVRSQFEKIFYNKGIDKIIKDIEFLEKDLSSF